VQELEIRFAHALPGVVRGAGVDRIALAPAEKALDASAIAIEQLDNLEKADVLGFPVQPVAAAVASRRVDDPGVAKRPHDLGQVVGGIPACSARSRPSIVSPSANLARKVNARIAYSEVVVSIVEFFMKICALLKTRL